MSASSNVIHARRIAPGLLLGALGVLGFSFTLPATKAAVADFDPVVVALGRAVTAAALAGVVLAATKAPLPARRHWARLGLVSMGVVVGFPLFSTLALHRLTAAHGAIITGLLPAATAVLAVLLAGERPGATFWLVCLAGLAAVLAFAASQGAGRPRAADGLALAAVFFGAVGYAEGAIVAREIGGWRVICWALVIAVPVVVPIAGVAAARAGLHAGPTAWAGFAYVSVVSMFLAYFPWYQGLASGGVARISQVQLAQPVLTLVWSFLLLGEHIGPATFMAGAAVLLCAGASQRTRVRRRPSPPPPPTSTEPVLAGASLAVPCRPPTSAGIPPA